MNPRPVLPLFTAMLLLGAGCSSDSQTRANSTAAVDRLPKRCRGLESAIPAAEVTFVSRGGLYATTPDGSTVRCIIDDVDAERIAWGGGADRVLADGAQTTLHTPDANVAMGEEQQATSWSRPTGTSAISVSPDGRLLKQSTEGADAADISFLERHDEAVYHPAGTHIATVGSDDGGTYGLFISNNEGRDEQLVAVGESAKRIYNLAFNHAGDTLYYAAEHNHRFDLHSLKVTKTEVGNSGTVDSRLGTLFSGPDDVTKIVVSEFSSDPLIAFQTHCRTRIISGDEESPLDGSLGDDNSEPVGWLSDGTLLVLAYDDGCEGPGQLFAVASGEPTLVAEHVDAAASRAVLPPPPEPPDVDPGVVA
jgi:hypothetical protein